MVSAYLQLSQKELERRALEAYEIYRECCVCPRSCGVDRTAGVLGFCKLNDELNVSSATLHFGEEPPFTGGSGGVGNIFVASCNLACSYCQNYQISQQEPRAGYSTRQVAEEMVKLQKQGANFIGWVSPSHVVPGLLQSLCIARELGLTLPIIYNTNAYDALPTLKLLDGIVDIYLPDIKYADDELARKHSKGIDYGLHSKASVLEMYRQVGPLKVGHSGLAEGGILVRHLVLPNGLAGTWETLCFIALELSANVPVSLMSQYRPVHKALDVPELSRKITADEYQTALDMANDLGIKTIFAQDLNSEIHNLPDFDDIMRPFPLQKATVTG
ncbi:MAG: radical SAM protein [Nitrospinae bacterium CG11_big_fil_rev_8_21_14_0_20_45_15]|nr:MAG: radical SAM protein [Nitrospinae bacterium CG11_big_fil_rev_8_21_14_0_20_45_15]